MSFKYHFIALFKIIDIFSNDIHDDATRLFKCGPMKITSQQTVIDLDAIATPSYVFDRFQYLLYLLSLKPERVELAKIERFLDLMLDVLEKQQLVSSGYKSVAFQLLQMALLIGEFIDINSKDGKYLTKIFQFATAAIFSQASSSQNS